MAITEQNIMNYIAHIGQPAGIHTSVWAVKMPSVINMMVWGPMANLFDLRYNILNISRNCILIIGVNGAGNLTPLYIRLSQDNIRDIKLKKRMSGCDVEIVTTQGSLKYRINKFMIGSGFQNTNYENTINMLKNFKVQF